MLQENLSHDGGGIDIAHGANLAWKVDGPRPALWNAPALQGCHEHVRRAQDRILVLPCVPWWSAPNPCWGRYWGMVAGIGGRLALLYLVLCGLASVRVHIAGPVWRDTHDQPVLRRGLVLPLPLVEEGLRQADRLPRALLRETWLSGVPR